MSKSPADIVNWVLSSKKTDEDSLQEMTSPGVVMLDKIKSRIQSKPVKDQLNFYKSFSDKLQALFMDETPSADPKFAKFIRDIKGSFMDMLGGEEENDGALEVDDMEDEEESFSDIVGDDFDDEDFEESETEDDSAEVEVEEAKKMVKKSSPYADKMAKVKAKIASMAAKKKAMIEMGKKVKASKDPGAKKKMEQINKKKKALTNELIGLRGALNTFRVMNKKWKEKQKAKK